MVMAAAVMVMGTMVMVHTVELDHMVVTLVLMLVNKDAVESQQLFKESFYALRFMPGDCARLESVTMALSLWAVM